ncbi:Hypothetical protein SCF082_LOCUS40790 [Durusdinium trenchii]|uniref:Uncharacterized protein n=1 Tax=Durusdinium trenchii TaxID=1381693 RepID=A0ABP0QD98_9DINO
MWPLHRACRLRPRRSLRGLSLALVFAVALCASDNQRRTFIPMRALPVPGRSILPAFGALHWWSQAAAWAEEQGLPKKSLYATAEEAKAAAEKLKAAGVQANLLEEPIDIRPPVVPKDAEPSAMVRDLVKEALDAIFQGDIGSAFNIISDIIAEAQAAIEEDGIPWEQVGPFFLGVVLLANVAQFVYPLMEEAMEEDDYDRLPMPSDLPSGQRRAPRIVQEEVDLKLPPKPMSQIVAEDAAKKVAKKPDQDYKDEKSERSA